MTRGVTALWLSCVIVSCSVAQADTVTPLEIQQPVERDIRAGETHLFDVPLKTGELVRGVLEQQGIAVNLKAYFPDGSKVRSFGGPGQAQKTFRMVAEAPGNYRLELKAAETGGPGHYRIEVQQIQPMSERLKIVPEEPYHSPRLTALRQQLEAGNRNALAEFWQEIEKQGTPLVEAISGDDENLLVTFLWRATFETHNVLVMWTHTMVQLEKYQMAPIPSTDVWFKSLPMPKGARFHYQLSPNDTLSRATNAQRFATAQLDPLNPKRDPKDPGVTKYEVSSIAELPGAAPDLWSSPRPGVQQGKLQQHEFQSTLLNNARRVTVYTPAGYSADGAPYRLLLLFDGAAYIDAAAAPTTLDNLIWANKIPPLVAAFINTKDQATRTRELVCNPKFADALHQELLPWLRKQYHVTNDPSQVAVGGLSHGGLAAVYVALQHPESFGNVLSQSGTFWWSPRKDLEETRLRRGDEEGNWIVRQFIQRERLPVRFYLEAGLFENDVFGSGGQILEENRRLRDVLRAKGHEVHYQEFVGGHNLINWRITLPGGLIALFGSPEHGNAK